MSTAAKSSTRVLWESVRELSRPLVVYWLFLAIMFAAFSAAAILDDPSADSMQALFVFGLVTAGSVLVGQVMALLRLRDWLVYAYWAFMWTFGLTFGVFSAAAVGPLSVLIIIWVILGPLFTLGGLWSLRVNRAIYASWVPLVYATGTAIIMAESKGKVSTWESGSKWAVWDVFTFSVLGIAIALMLAYLVMRETHRLHLWRRGPTAPLAGTVQESGAARPRLSCLGWVMIAMLAMGLAVGTAIMGPFLWRTGPGDGDGSGEGGEPIEEPAEPSDGSDGADGQDEQEGSKDPRDRARQQADTVSEQIQQDMQERMEQSINLLSTLLLLLLLFLAALLTFWRPGRRLLTVRHCRKPFWSVPNTTRIEQGWRLVELAMADIGVPPRPGEPAESLYNRARPALEKVSGGAREVHGLLEAARIRDRVAYGLGVAPGEAELMQKVCGWAYDTVWDRLGDKGQIKALYRGTPSR